MLPAKRGQMKGKAMAIEAKFANSQEAKKQGWYSRRHRTSDAHVQNLADNSRKARKSQRREDAIARSKLRALRTPQQQMTRLNERLGVAIGAQKERERLATLIVQP